MNEGPFLFFDHYLPEGRREWSVLRETSACRRALAVSAGAKNSFQKRKRVMASPTITARAKATSV